ncbi:MAG TPA: hypothetical protein VK539_38405 [Myxococcaceae bacterium]|nr:hypothetical protein [Myxococcaceae bacterium]
MRLLVLGMLACLFACSGPPAPDAALCQDVVTRLCQARTCAGLNEQLSLGTQECQATLLQRTSCAEEEFAFSEPSRERFLSCRQPLVKRSTDPGKAPTCEEVAAVVRDCPDVIDFLGGR